jgi:D-alanyl-D-alanine carboxypeptidase
VNFQDEATQIILERLTEKKILGMSVAIRAEGQVIFEHIAGSEDKTNTKSLQLSDTFYIYSVTKPLIAIATLQLVERKLLNLDLDVRTVLNLAFEIPVTLRQLLNHSAGIPDYSQIFDDYLAAIKAHPQQPWTRDEFLSCTLPIGLAFPAGQGWAYSNMGYLLVRMLIEKVTGQSLRDILEQSIFKPLYLEKTRVVESLDDCADLTPGYSQLLSATDELEDMSKMYHPGWVSHGVVVSTASELAMIFESLFLGRVLNSDSLEVMKQTVIVPGKHPLFGKTGYGLGLMIDLEPKLSPVYGHGGEGPGYSAAAFHFSDLGSQQVTITALANCESDDSAMNTVFALAHLLGKRI